MHALRTLFIALGLVFAAAPSLAGTLYEDLGGLSGIETIVGRTIDLSFTDARTKETFKNSKPHYLKKMITEQIAALSGGPVTYTGLDMKRAHKGLGLTTLHFNALVELLQQAMNESHIPYRTQNRLLALLAPMHRDVVERTLPGGQTPASAKP
jgi:hemoglobin